MFSSNTTQVPAVTQAEAVDFDGTNDYLSRSTVLSGAANSKTFTLSFWFWAPALSADCTFYEEDTGSSYRFVVQWVVSSTSFRVFARNTSGTNVLVANYVLEPAALTNTFYNILVSVDLASTSNRYFYVNDQAVSPSWTTYTNQDIGFANSTRYVVSNNLIEAQYAKTRLSNFYRDNTYRDMSVTANRRLFITADLKPAAGQAALSPILYLPMSDPTTVATNTGTGGNFTLTGTVARSGRGPNQYNAPYSDLDGSADYLSRTTAPTGIADSPKFTIAFSFMADTTGVNIVGFGSSTATRFNVQLLTTGLSVSARNTTGSLILSTDTTGVTFVVGRNYSVVVSVDLTDTAKRFVYINGQAVSATWSTYTNDLIDFNISTSPRYHIGNGVVTTSPLNGKLGALWFNTSYIDLSVATNLAKFVTGTGIDAKPVDLGATGELPTGTAPLIYLPMYGNNAGKNYGTGGDFTVNSGPYTGARGPNEFWGNGVTYSSTGSTLSNTSGDGASSSTFTFSVWLQATGSGATAGDPYVIGFGPGNSRYIYVYWAVGSGRQMYFNNFWTGGTSAVSANFAVSSTGYTHLLVSKTGNTYQCYVNGVSTTMTVTGTVGNWVDGQKYIYFGSDAATQAAVGELFLTTQYFDLSQEANRLIFRDCFGNPTNLSLAITNGTLTNPKYYLRFAPSAFGANAGTGGDFTTTGTLLDKGQY